MSTEKNQAAVRALLDEYNRSLSHLEQVISGINEIQLMTIIDPDTTDENCKSIQTILAHVVNSGYSYAVYIDNWRTGNAIRPEKQLRNSIADYIRDLNAMFEFTKQVFANIDDSQLERYTDSEKMLTRWNQHYDIEQLTEHAIVHILRHRRQIERFKRQLLIDNLKL